MTKIEGRLLEKIIINSESLKRWSAQYVRKRYLFNEIIKINKEFFVGIKGVRGIGKTVLLLQLANYFKDSVYFSADYSYLKPFSLYDIINSLRRQGFKSIFIDEIHTRPNWSQDVKTIYDEHEIRIFFTGSSGIELKRIGADLSRRVVLSDMKPASFREYMIIKKGTNIPRYSLNTIVKKKKEITLKHTKLAEYIDEYMRYGGVLYNGEGFNEALGNSIEKMITKDLAALREIDIKYEYETYRLLYHIAQSPPYKFSYSSVSRKLGFSKTFAIRLLKDLQAIGLLKIVLPCRKKGIDVKKEPKVYFSVPYRYYFNDQPNIGSLREEFFVNHVPVKCYLKGKRGEKTPDFNVDRMKIEVGGTSKKGYQKPDLIAVDGLRFDSNYIPLFLFGLLY